MSEQNESPTVLVAKEEYDKLKERLFNPYNYDQPNRERIYDLILARREKLKAQELAGIAKHDYTVSQGPDLVECERALGVVCGKRGNTDSLVVTMEKIAKEVREEGEKRRAKTVLKFVLGNKDHWSKDASWVRNPEPLEK